MKYVVMLKTDGTTKILEVPEKASYDWYADQIDCDWIEVVRPKHIKKECVLIVDEEGLLKDRIMWNPHASAMYGFLEHGQPIAGDCLLMREEPGEDGYHLVGLEEAEARGWKQELDDSIADILKEIYHKIETE